MRSLAALIADAVHALRLVTPGQWCLRTIGAACLAAATLLCLAWFPTPLDFLLMIVIAVTGAWAFGRPDSLAPLLSTAALCLWWVVAAGDADWWRTSALALLVAAFHVTVAQAAAAPTYATISRRAAASMLAKGLGYLAASAGAMLVVAAVTSIPDDVVPRGIAWIVVALVAIVSAGTAVLSRIRAD
ncbi:MAG: hypothetical protein IPJ61_03185 [Tessaracoccus sp.]|uniref:hypothetical protein n=1 Tax=Tessaracoccus sp. TaxID=1971211 RepID=UPI001EB9CE64|nr:hypothetical protein [Tessaracoccus sp.]MBK7820091.1 hypothetical protein [Tessaracoccus sp.]